MASLSPATVIEVEANRVTRVKGTANDGYRAVQVTTGAKKLTVSPSPERVTLLKAA